MAGWFALGWLVCWLLAACPASAEPAKAVGEAACAACHPDQAARWRTSHHAHAMERASTASVRGDFSGVTVGTGADRTRFFRDGDAFDVDAVGRDGRRAVFRIAYTFGIDPLQQYLIASPDGRMQVFDLAWDTRPRSAGGQRWFRPLATAAPGDKLHWTGREMNWNFACAPCHSTGVRKNYDAAADRFATSWTDVDVGCEACHGAGSAHVAWARSKQGSTQADAGRGLGVPLGAADVPRFAFATPAQAIARPAATASSAKLGDLCAPCHSRREQLVDAPLPGDAFLDDYRPALLDTGLYQPDGQNAGEVFEYGAFAQSRMAQAGVTCVNCHEPHDLSLKASGNGVCAQCHRTATFDSVAHTHHAARSPGGQCIACHMPSRTYMGVHVRHDHGFRLPRPELADIGVSNGCTGCHADRTAAWLAAAAMRSWGVTPRPTGFADAFAASRDGAPADRRLLTALGDASLPGIVRGTAASLLAEPQSPQALAALQQAERDAEPLARLGVARIAARLEPPLRITLAAPLLDDERRAVRLEAAQSLADVPPALLDRHARKRLASALVELTAALETAQDRPESWLQLGSLSAGRGDPAKAAADFDRALALAPDFTPARLDLADLDRAAGDEAGAAAVLSEAVRAAPSEPAPLEALALSDVRRGDRTAAIGRVPAGGVGAVGK